MVDLRISFYWSEEFSKIFLIFWIFRSERRSRNKIQERIASTRSSSQPLQKAQKGRPNARRSKSRYGCETQNRIKSMLAFAWLQTLIFGTPQEMSGRIHNKIPIRHYNPETRICRCGTRGMGGTVSQTQNRVMGA